MHGAGLWSLGPLRCSTNLRDSIGRRFGSMRGRHGWLGRNDFHDGFAMRSLHHVSAGNMPGSARRAAGMMTDGAVLGGSEFGCSAVGAAVLAATMEANATDESLQAREQGKRSNVATAVARPLATRSARVAGRFTVFAPVRAATAGAACRRLVRVAAQATRATTATGQAGGNSQKQRLHQNRSDHLATFVDERPHWRAGFVPRREWKAAARIDPPWPHAAPSDNIRVLSL